MNGWSSRCYQRHARTQSAYRQFHSTETVLLKIFSDIATATDSGYVTALCRLDLFAAFVTVDYDILLARLKNTYGFVGLTIKWLRTYLENRAFHVQYNGELSSSTILTCGVPQGSILGLLLFVMYTAQLEDITRKHNY